MKDKIKELDNFFLPKSMAIVGVSEALTSYGARYIQALLDFGFKGRLYAVNHNGENVLGFKIYRSVLDIPDELDLASICVPARFTPDILRDCVKKEVKAAIILSAGFSEAGEEGRETENELIKIAGQGIRIMGPNCFGTYCPKGGITIVPGGGFPKQSGVTSLIAQSGQLSEGITSRSFGEGIRYSKVASYGNACNLNEADLLEYLMRDEDTKIFTSYLEGVRDGRRFFATARKYAGKKPIILWKVGLTGIGAAAAASHTGSLAGSVSVWDAFFRQTRAIKAGTLEEMIDTNVGFTCLPQGCGRRISLVSGGGAGTVVGADACESAGLIMPPLTPETEAKLREVLPPTGTSIKNPLDIGNPHPPLSQFQSILETVASSDQTDVIVIRRIFFSIKVSEIFSGTTAPSREEQQALLDIPVNIKKRFNKPVVIILPEEITTVENIDLEEERRQIRDFFFKNNIPVYLNEHRAFTALSHLAEFRDASSLEQAPERSGIAETPSKGRTILSGIIKTASTPVLDEIQCKRVMKEYGIKVTKPVLAKSKDDAIDAARRIGFPVVMKIVSPQITHKSDIGGVRVGLKSEADIKKAYKEIMKAAKDNAPGAVIEGISVQKMTEKGLELVIGMSKDPQFGPMIMFGLGGTLVEILKDVAFRFVPLTGQDAREMIRQVKAYRLLEGYRGQPPVDIKYIEELLLKVSRMIEENPEIKEMDINPLIAYGKGAVAVDARIILEEGAVR
ncbi:MAG: acetate--CoA ligase family protein [Deltaproteobacteria bacterium]|nr:acetate--CoA ligase family protein [Deltaproteobacteria bacterium]